jgi:hypothetical protein
MKGTPAPDVAMTTIRPANVQDADQLAQLRWDFRIEGGTPPSTTLDGFIDEMRSFVGDLLAGGTAWRAWVAEDGDRLVGWCGSRSSSVCPIRTFVVGSDRSRT